MFSNEDCLMTYWNACKFWNLCTVECKIGGDDNIEIYYFRGEQAIRVCFIEI